MLVRLLSFHLCSLAECFWNWCTEWFLVSVDTNLVVKVLHSWRSASFGLFFGGSIQRNQEPCKKKPREANARKAHPVGRQ